MSEVNTWRWRLDLSSLSWQKPASTANNNRCDKWKRVSCLRVFSSSLFKCLSEAVVSSFNAHKRRWSFYFSFMHGYMLAARTKEFYRSLDSSRNVCCGFGFITPWRSSGFYACMLCDMFSTSVYFRHWTAAIITTCHATKRHIHSTHSSLQFSSAWRSHCNSRNSTHTK